MYLGKCEVRDKRLAFISNKHIFLVKKNISVLDDNPKIQVTNCSQIAVDDRRNHRMEDFNPFCYAEDLY